MVMPLTEVIKNTAKPIWFCIKDIPEAPKRLDGVRLSRKAEIDYRKVVLICNMGRGYLCNPKYISEALNRLYPGKFDLVLLLNEPQDDIPSYVRQVAYGSHQARYELSTARFWIDNCRRSKYVPKRKDQIYIQTWHAYLSPKRVEGDVAEHLPYEYVRDAKRDGIDTDLMFADNRLYEDVYRRAFWYSGPIVRCGNPRNRPLVLGDDIARRKVRNILGIPEDELLCVYAPTFRRNEEMDAYRFNYDALIHALSERFGRKFTFAYRLHPNIAKLHRPDFLQKYADASFYKDAQELLSATDVLLTDYSSIMEDFMLTGRPGFIYAPDVASYSDDRGFYYSLQDRPFPVAQNEEELLSEILRYSEDEHKRDVERFSKMIGLEDDGRGDEAIAKIINSLAIPGVTVEEAIGRG